MASRAGGRAGRAVASVRLVSGHKDGVARLVARTVRYARVRAKNKKKLLVTGFILIPLIALIINVILILPLAIDNRRVRHRLALHDRRKGSATMN